MVDREVLQPLHPTSSFEKLMVAEAVIIDLTKQLKAKDVVIFELRELIKSHNNGIIQSGKITKQLKKENALLNRKKRKQL